jgi:nuclear pore complex protein Nup85
MTELTPIIQNHPRSKDFDTEFEYFTAHRRWRETSVGGFRKRVDDLDEDDGRGFQPDGGEWRDQVESLCKILEGDRETYFDVAKGWDWDWRDALGVWGVWFDIKLTRESFPYV